ncbi:MAG: ABC transporter ATP-binding protein [Actinomycetota bacterium]
MTDSALTLTGVTKRFADVVAVDGVDLDLAGAELLALVGPSGCGKSTLLRTIAGLVGIDGGAIRLGGELADDGGHRLPPERRSIGLVFQEHALFPHLTVRANIGFGVRGVAKVAVATRVDEVLDMVSLPRTYGDRYPHELSGGERQRVALARALAPGPALMLFDEPFASLDPNLRAQLRHEVASTLRSTGTPAVFVTHDQRDALAIGDRIAVMRSGRIVQIDTPSSLYERPADTFVGAFMGEASFLPIDDQGATALGVVEGADPQRQVAMIRPDDLRFVAGTGAASVVATEYQGSLWLCTVALGDGSEIRVAADPADAPERGATGRVALREGRRQVAVER